MRLNASWMLIVLALALAPAAACTGGGDDGEEGTSTPPATSTGSAGVLPPTNFAARPAASRVVLTWARPAGDVDDYALYRDGVALASVPGSEARFTDEDVSPGEAYTYEIEARLGDETSGRVAVDTETTLPPVEAARVEGSFNVSTRVASQSGYSDYRRSNFGWRFRPRCREGPCDVLWADLHLRRLRATLNRSGARYRGTYTGRFLIECGGSASTSRVTLDLRVDAARAIGADWRATRLSGTLDHSESPQLGCVASAAELEIRARLVQ